MESLTIGQILAKPPPVSLTRLAGRLVQIFPVMTFGGDGSLQNAFLRDETSEDEVKIMFKNFGNKLNLESYKDGYIEIVATAEEDICWRPQLHRGKAIGPKIEIEKTVKIVRLVQKGQYLGPLGLRAEPAAPVEVPAVPAAPAPAPVVTPGKEPIHFPGPVALEPPVSIPDEIARMGDLIEVCAGVANELAKRLEPLDLKAPDLVRDLTFELFRQAGQRGLDQRLRPATEATSAAPSPKSRFLQLIAGREKRAEAILQLLKCATTVEEITDEKAAELLEAASFQALLAS